MIGSLWSDTRGRVRVMDFGHFVGLLPRHGVR
jgi:hypothetical protein